MEAFPGVGGSFSLLSFFSSTSPPNGVNRIRSAALFMHDIRQGRDAQLGRPNLSSCQPCRYDGQTSGGLTDDHNVMSTP